MAELGYAITPKPLTDTKIDISDSPKFKEHPSRGFQENWKNVKKLRLADIQNTR